MPNPTPQDGHFDQLLSNISIAFIQSQNKFVAPQVFPVVPVNNASDFYLEFPRGAFFRDEVGPRPLGGQSRIGGFTTTKKPYYAEEQGLSSNLDDRERANATPPYDPERSRIIYLTQQHLIHRDRDWAAKYFKPGVWTTDLTGEASAPGQNQFLQFDQDNSDPIQIVDEYRDNIAEQTGFEPNVIVMGRKVFRVIKNHPAVVERIVYTQRGIVTAELLAELLGVDKVVIPGGVNNTAAEGQDDDFQFIVGKNDMLMAYAAPSAGLDQPTAGYTFAWTGLLPNAGMSGQAGVWRGREDRAHSDWFEVRMAYDMHVVSADLGVFFGSAVS